jgi:adiponectin receptor
MVFKTPRMTSQTEDSSKMASYDSWWTLVGWDNLEHWMQDNHHIQSNYRRASYSYARSFASIFHVHNETVNIWTHLLPAMLSLPSAAVLYNTLKPRYEKATSADVAAMSFFFLGTLLCLGMSAIYHTLSNHSPKVSKTWNQLDYAGIACLIAGSFVPSVYYGFWCEPGKQILYWTMVGADPLDRLSDTDYHRSELWVRDVPLPRFYRSSGPLHGGRSGLPCSWAWVSRQLSLSLMV